MGSDLKLVAGKAVAEQQSDLKVERSDFFERGGRIVVVTEIDGDRITWRTDFGGVVEGTLEEFKSAWLTWIDTVHTEGDDGDFLGHAWIIASARGVPFDIRVRTLHRTIRRAPRDECRQEVLGWIKALALSSEPVRHGHSTPKPCPTCKEEP